MSDVKKLKNILKMIVLCFILSGCSIISSPTRPNPTSPTTQGSTTQTPIPPTPKEMLDTLNEARQQSRNCGGEFFAAAQPLRWEPRLAEAARKHSKDMANGNYTSHTGSDGSSPQNRISKEGYDWESSAENIAAGQNSYLQTLQGWLESPNHCRNIMNPNFQDFGAGYGYDKNSNYLHYWTQNFGTLRR